MAFTTYLQQQVLNHVFRGQTYSPPSTLYLGLLTSSGEVTISGYERKPVEFSAPGQSGGRTEVKNSSEVRFNVALEDWGEITGAVIYDSASGGNALNEASLNNARTIYENDQLVIPVDNLTVQLD